MTAKEVYEASKEWDLTSYAACLTFSDWLLEHGEVKWANMMRWVSYLLFIDKHERYQFWRELVGPSLNKWIILYDKIDYDSWKRTAKHENLEIISENPL